GNAVVLGHQDGPGQRRPVAILPFASWVRNPDVTRSGGKNGALMAIVDGQCEHEVRAVLRHNGVDFQDRSIRARDLRECFPTPVTQPDSADVGAGWCDAGSFPGEPLRASGFQVVAYDLPDCSFGKHLAPVKQHGFVAETLDRGNLMANEEDSPTIPGNVLHF